MMLMKRIIKKERNLDETISVIKGLITSPIKSDHSKSGYYEREIRNTCILGITREPNSQTGVTATKDEFKSFTI